MRNSLSYITLGVSDLPAALRFYRDGLGLETEGLQGDAATDSAAVFFRLPHNMVLALWPRESLARQCGVEPGPAAASQIMLAHNVANRQDVDELLARAEAAGARVTRPASHFAWGGYGGCFLTPDQHLWEIVWSPTRNS